MPGEFIARNGMISRGNVVVTGSLITSGSLTTTGTITATTLVVQTITSSISSITGSTNFGSIAGNTHTFTGSLNVTGSLSVVTTGTEFQVTNTGVRIGNVSTDVHPITGSVNVSGSATFISSVTANGVMSLGDDGTYGSTYKTLGLTGTTNGSHRIFAGTADDIYIAAATARGIYFWTDGSSATRMRILTNGNVGIGTNAPAALLETRVAGESPATGKVALIAATSNGVNDIFRWFDGNTQLGVFKNNGSVGIGTANPLGTLSTIGGAVQIMGDYQNHQTIIKSAGAGGTFNGALTITIPEMSNANIDGYGGYSCEVYVAGYQGLYCHAWFGGYINGGIVPSEATILRSSGGWSISQSQYGTYGQGFQFTIDYPSGIIHPAARIIFNKGGSPNSTAYPANSITAVFS